jgi:hypothetical protein
MTFYKIHISVIKENATDQWVEYQLHRICKMKRCPILVQPLAGYIVAAPYPSSNVWSTIIIALTSRIILFCITSGQDWAMEAACSMFSACMNI